MLRPSRAGIDLPRPDTRGDRAGQAHRVADRHDELPDPQHVSVTELGRGCTGRVSPEDGEVGEGVRADHVEPRLQAVAEGRGATGRAGDDVCAGEEESVIGEGDRRSGATAACGAYRQGGDAR
jgi:hypothetical protein